MTKDKALYAFFAGFGIPAYPDTAVLNENGEPELSAAIGYGGVRLSCDEGYIWLKRGSPWCQNLSDETDPFIKRRYINVTAEYQTLY